jgi:hypothetical protein
MAVLALNILQHLSSGLGDRMRREMQRRGYVFTSCADYSCRWSELRLPLERSDHHRLNGINI